MIYALLLLLLIACFIVNDILLEMKVKKLEKEIIAKESMIGAFEALDKAISKLNTGFKDHERRINNIEKLLLSEKHEEPKEPKYTCNDCKYYHALSGVGFTGAINYGFSNGISHFKCEKIGCTYPIECNGTCQLFEKTESIDEDEDEDVIYYANNVKVDISSKAPQVVYKTDGLLPEEYVSLVSKLYYSD